MKKKSRHPKSNVSFREFWLWAPFSCWLIFLGSKAITQDPNGEWYAQSYAVWGDWSAHLTFVNHTLQNGFQLWSAEHPLFSSYPSNYPPLMNFLTAITAKIFQLSPVESLRQTLFLTLALAPPVLLSFTARLDFRPSTRLIGFFVFLFFGGIGFFNPEVFQSSLPWSNNPEHHLHFTQLVSFEWIPQRSFALGMILGVLILVLDQTLFENRKPSVIQKSLALLFLLVLPWAHAHSFMVIAGMLFLKALIRRNTSALTSAVTAIISGYLFYLWLNRGTPATSMTWAPFRLGWMNTETNFILFWLKNTGFFLPLAGYGFWRFRKNFPLLLLSVSGFGIFVLGNIVQFQASDYDNLKLFTWAWFFLSLPVALGLQSFWEKHHLGFKVFSVVLLGTLVTTGIHDQFHFLNGSQKTKWISTEELESSKELLSLRKNPSDRTIISPDHLHFAPRLSGQTVWMGYTGWLWSWGLPYASRETQWREVWEGQSTAIRLIQEHKLKYLIIRQNDLNRDPKPNLDFFSNHFRQIQTRSGFLLFDLTQTKSP